MNRGELNFVGKTLDSYVFLELIGKGAFGGVYKARHLKTQELVAIKTVPRARLKAEGLEKYFQTELLIMQTVKHPNVLAVSDSFQNAEYNFVVMKLYADGDLDKLLKRQGRFPEADAVRFIMQILEGFRELHSQKIIHRDFKLANILLEGDKVVIADFGLAVRGLEMTRTPVGTPLTRAPEIKFGQAYDTRVDIWSMGICFYQLLTGKYPFMAKNEVELANVIQMSSGDKLQFPKDIQISEPCKSLIRWMLQVNPRNRIYWTGIYTHPLFQIGNSNSMEESVIKFNPQDDLHQKQHFEKMAQKNDLPAIVSDSQEFQANNIEKKAPTSPIPDKPTAVERPTDLKLLEEETKFAIIDKRLTYEKDLLNSTLKAARDVRKMNPRMVSQALILAYLLLKRCKIRASRILEGLEKGTEGLEVGVEWVNKIQKTGRLTGRFKDLRVFLEGYLSDYILVMEHWGNEKISKEEQKMEFREAVGFPMDDVRPTDKLLISKWVELAKDMKTITFTSEEMDVIFRALAKCYLHMNPEKRLSFCTEGKYFDWTEFEMAFNAINVRDLVLKSA